MWTQISKHNFKKVRDQRISVQQTPYASMLNDAKSVYDEMIENIVKTISRVTAWKTGTKSMWQSGSICRWFIYNLACLGWECMCHPRVLHPSLRVLDFNLINATSQHI